MAANAATMPTEAVPIARDALDGARGVHSGRVKVACSLSQDGLIATVERLAFTNMGLYVGADSSYYAHYGWARRTALHNAERRCHRKN